MKGSRAMNMEYCPCHCQVTFERTCAKIAKELTSKEALKSGPDKTARHC